jgi:hypothetical protein
MGTQKTSNHADTVDIATGGTNSASAAKNVNIATGAVTSGSQTVNVGGTDNLTALNLYGVSTFVGKPETVDAGATASASTLITFIASTGAGTVTLPAAVAGKVKYLVMIAHVGDITVAIEGGAVSKTFNAVGDSGIFVSDGTNWYCLGANNI